MSSETQDKSPGAGDVDEDKGKTRLETLENVPVTGGEEEVTSSPLVPPTTDSEIQDEGETSLETLENVPAPVREEEATSSALVPTTTDSDIQVEAPLVPKRRKPKKSQAPAPPASPQEIQQVDDQNSDPPEYEEPLPISKIQGPKIPENIQISEPSQVQNSTPPPTLIVPENQASPKYLPMEIFASVVASLSFLCIGLMRAYTSPAIALMKDDHNFFNAGNPMSKTVISWVAAAPPLGSFFGTLLAGLALQYCGRQTTLVILTLPFISGWLLVGLARNTSMVMIGRALTGLAAGFATATAQLYVSECVRAKVRGLLGILPAMMLSLGILLGFSLSTLRLDWQELALLMTCFPILLLLFSIAIPESPSWLLMRGKEAQAVKSLKKLRGLEDQVGTKGLLGTISSERVNTLNLEIEQELQEMKNVMKKQHMSCIEDGKEDQESQDFVQFVFKELLGKREIWFPAFVSLSLMVFQQFTGANAVIFYLSLILTEAAPTDMIMNNSSFITPGASNGYGGHHPASNNFHSSGGGLDHNLSSVMIGLVQFFGFFLSLPLIDRVGRRVLLIKSAILMILPHIVLGLYFYMKLHPTSYIHNYKYEAIINMTKDWLPLTCLCAFIASYSIGFGPVPFIIMSEIFPSHARSYMCAMASLVNHLTLFFIIRVFPTLIDWIGAHVIFWLFAIFCFLAAVHVAIVVPETKGKTLAEIELEFMGKERRESLRSCSDLVKGKGIKEDLKAKVTECSCKHERSK